MGRGMGQRRPKVLLALAQYANSAATDTARSERNSQYWGDRLNVTIWFHKTNTDTSTVDMDFEVTPDSAASGAIWYVSDSFTQSASATGNAEDKQPTALGMFARIHATLGAAGESQANPKIGAKATYPLVGFDS